MPKLIQFEGQDLEFDDNISDDQILAFLAEQKKPATWDETFKAMPGVIDRTLAEVGAGMTQVFAKVTGDDALSEEATNTQKYIQEEAQLQTPKNMSLPQEAALSVGPSLVLGAPAILGGTVAAPLLGAGAALGVATTGIGIPTGLSKFSESLAYGLPTDRATVHGVLHGLIEKYTEYFPLKELISGGKLTGQLFRFFGKEVAGEELATIGQFINDKLSTKPDATLGDLAHEMAVTALATAMIGPIQAGAVKTVATVMAPFIKPELITPEQQETILRANAMVGNVPPPVVPPGVAPVNPPGAPPATTPEGVQATLTAGLTPPAVNPVDLSDKVLDHPTKEGTVRLYTVVPEVGGDEMKGHMTWYRSLEEVQEALDAGGPQQRVPYIDVAPDELEASQKSEEIQEMRTELSTTPEQYVLPMSLAKQGQYLYNPPSPVASVPKVETPAPAAEPITKPKAESVRYTYKFDSGSTKLLFPDAWSKQAFLHAEHLDSVSGKKTSPLPITADQVAKERTALALAYDISEEGVASMATAYRNSIAELARTNAGKTVEVQSKPVHVAQEKMEALIDTEEQYYASIAEQYGEVGKVNVVKDVPKTPRTQKMQALLQKWLTVFAPGTQLIIIHQAPKHKPRGRYKPYKGVGMITIPPEEISDLRAYFVLAHEFGHHLVEMVLNAPQHTQAKAVLQGEWQQIKDNIRNMTAQQYLDRWTGPHRLAYQEEVLRSMGVEAGDPALAFIQAQDAKSRKGYSLDFHEYGAEQFARYAAKRTGELYKSEPRVMALFRDIAKEVKNFYDKVVRKIAPETKYDAWLDGLRTNPEAVQAAETKTQIGTALDDAHWALVDEQYEYTLKTLERLPKKEKVRRDTITQTLRRPDVRKQEKDLIESVLQTFDGDVIDRAQLYARVSEKIVPLTTVLTLTYAHIGLSAIGVNAGAVDAQTELFLLPFTISNQNNHFGNSRYFAHARWYQPLLNPETRSILELQSDLAQQLLGGKADPKKLLAAAEQEDKNAENSRKQMTYHAEVAEWVRNLPLTSPAWGNRAYRAEAEVSSRVPPYVWEDVAKELSAGFGETWLSRLQHLDLAYPAFPKATTSANWISSTLKDPVIKALDERRVNNSLRLTEAETRAANLRARAQGFSDSMRRVESLPDNWWEIMLRKLNSEASGQGIKKMRLATAETVAKIEGWSKIRTFHSPQFSTELVEQLRTVQFSTKTNTDLVVHLPPKGTPFGAYETPLYDDGDGEGPQLVMRPKQFTYEQVNVGGGHTVWVPWAEIKQAKLVPDNVITVIDEIIANSPETYGEEEGIFRRYKKEITNFVKKEFGAKEITEFSGQNTGTVEVTPEYRSVFEAHEKANLGVLNTWLEWDVKPDLGDVPVEYYDLTDSIAQTQKVVDSTSTADTPEISRGFQNWFWFTKKAFKLSQVARLLPNVRQLQNFKRAQEERANMANKLMEPANERINEWYSLSKNDSMGIMRMLEDEVKGGVHWTNMIADPEAVVEGVKKVVYHHVMTPKVAAEAQARGVSEKAIQVYLGIKNDYLTSLGHAEDTIINSIDYYFRKNPLVANTRKSIARQLFNKLRQSPWLPDRRFGQWVTMVKLRQDEIFDGQQFEAKETVYRAHHRTRRQAEREFAELRKQYGPDRFAVSVSYMEDVQYAMRGMPRKMIESIPEALLLNAEQMDRFRELYYDFSKEGAYLKMLGKDKKRIRGAEQDLRLSYSDYLWRTANLLSKMRYGPRLAHELSSLKRAARAIHVNGGNAAPIEQLHEYMTHNYNYIMRPQAEWEALRAAVSMWYLWGVPKSAVMNSMSLPITAYTHLAAKFGDVQAANALLKAMSQVTLYWKDPQKINPETAALLAQAKRDGVTTQSYAAELAAVKDGNAIERIMPTYSFLGDSGLKDTVRKTTWKTVHFGMLPFRVVEEFNRRVTLVAAYNLEKGLGKAPVTEKVGEGSAYAAAKESVSITQNEYAPWDRAPFMRGKPAILLIFMSFVQNVSFFMFGGDKGWWRAWLVLMFLAGWQGMPGMENLTDFLNWLARKTLDKPIDLRLEARELATAFNLNPDWIAHGAMHSMFGLGWDTASSVGLGRIIPGTDAVFGQGDANRRIMQMAAEIGGPFGGLTINVLQAIFDDNPSLLLKLDRALPTLVRNIERGYRGATEGKWTDMQGRPVVDEVTGVEVLGQMLGFSPTSKTAVQEERRYQRETAQFYVLRRQNLLSAMFQARLAKDADAIEQAKEKIRNYNSEVPDRQLRITAQDVETSMSRRERTAREALTGRAAVRRYRTLYEGIDPLFAE